MNFEYGTTRCGSTFPFSICWIRLVAVTSSTDWELTSSVTGSYRRIRGVEEDEVLANTNPTVVADDEDDGAPDLLLPARTVTK